MGKIYFQDKQECKTHGRTDKQITFKREEANKGMMGHFYSKFSPIFNKVFGSNG